MERPDAFLAAAGYGANVQWTTQWTTASSGHYPNLSHRQRVSSFTMKTKLRLETKLAKTVAGEDLAQGDYVATLMETVDVPSYAWNCGGFELSPHELVSLQLVPEDAGQPLKVLAVCPALRLRKNGSGRHGYDRHSHNANCSPGSSMRTDRLEAAARKDETTKEAEQEVARR